MGVNEIQVKLKIITIIIMYYTIIIIIAFMGFAF